VFQDNPRAFGSLNIDTTRMHELIGPTRVAWRDGIRRQVQCLAPQLLKD
jgi:UDP-glucuronate 4-epimerase